ncbi:MAG TPA: DUF1906 domain-containing protein [Thermoanaerobaculia bacterium]|nr:DUF1906 domain-containing protein [Thermoanaerobaculia bacterium]
MSDITSGLDSSSATDSTSLACLKQAGIGFIGRYYSRTTQIAGKKLTQSEAQLICQAGLRIVAVYEDGPTSYSYFSADRGVEDAQTAIAQAEAIGQPQGTAIYFTVDYNATQSDVEGNITAYFEAINQTIGGLYAAGVYGSGLTCMTILGAQLATYAWLSQSTGWTGYTNFSTWNIKQGPEHSVCGLNSDLDDGHGEFGGFTVTV